METLAKKYGLQSTQPINALVNAIRVKGGQEDAAAFEAAVRTVQTEYGKIMSGSTGAAGASVSALKKAGDSISEQMSFAQLQSVRKVLETDGKNVLDGFRDKVKTAGASIRSRGGSGGAGKGGGGGATSPDGQQTYTVDQLNEYAASKNISVDELVKKLGLNRGN